MSILGVTIKTEMCDMILGKYINIEMRIFACALCECVVGSYRGPIGQATQTKTLYESIEYIISSCTSQHTGMYARALKIWHARTQA